MMSIFHRASSHVPLYQSRWWHSYRWSMWQVIIHLSVDLSLSPRHIQWPAPQPLLRPVRHSPHRWHCHTDRHTDTRQRGQQCSWQRPRTTGSCWSTGSEQREVETLAVPSTDSDSERDTHLSSQCWESEFCPATYRIIHLMCSEMSGIYSLYPGSL